MATSSAFNDLKTEADDKKAEGDEVRITVHKYENSEHSGFKSGRVCAGILHPPPLTPRAKDDTNPSSISKYFSRFAFSGKAFNVRRFLVRRLYLDGRNMAKWESINTHEGHRRDRESC